MNSEVWFFFQCNLQKNWPSTWVYSGFICSHFEDHSAHLPSGFVRHSQLSVVCVTESYHLQPFWLGRWSRPQRKVYFFLRLGGIRKDSLTVRVIRHWNRLPCPERGRVTIPGGVWEASGNGLLFMGLQWQCWVDDLAWWSEGLSQPWWVYDLMKKLLFRNHFG